MSVVHRGRTRRAVHPFSMRPESSPRKRASRVSRAVAVQLRSIQKPGCARLRAIVPKGPPFVFRLPFGATRVESPLYSLPKERVGETCSQTLIVQIGG